MQARKRGGGGVPVINHQGPPLLKAEGTQDAAQQMNRGPASPGPRNSVCGPGRVIVKGAVAKTSLATPVAVIVKLKLQLSIKRKTNLEVVVRYRTLNLKSDL